LSLSDFKSAFSQYKGLTHLNNAGLCPFSRPAFETATHWLNRLYLEGMHANDDYLEALFKSRSTFGKLLGCSADQIAFFQSTSGAISQVAFGMDLKPQDEILMWEGEYSSNFYPWQEAARRSGAKVVQVALGPNFSTPVESLVSQITSRTKVIAISWVQFTHGSITDLQALMDCVRGRNIWTVVDAIQGVGIHPLEMDKLGIDAVCLGSHKWLAGPVGVGILALRKERISSLTPLMIGAHTYGTCEDPISLDCQLKTEADRFESGSRQVIDILALEASVKLILETGVPVIRREAERLSDKLREGLRAKGFTISCPNSGPHPGAIVNFTPSPLGPQTSAQLAETLKRAQISFALRGQGIRLSPHAFNSDEDIERVLEYISDPKE
jgi:selenocysteine lyase/cysteine desulfurase